MLFDADGLRWKPEKNFRCTVFAILGESCNRKYNIKTVVGADDYASMKEVVRRRYQRAIEEESPLPDLIITDGGKGQMEVVRQVMEELQLDMQIVDEG